MSDYSDDEFVDEVTPKKESGGAEAKEEHTEETIPVKTTGPVAHSPSPRSSTRSSSSSSATSRSPANSSQSASTPRNHVHQDTLSDNTIETAYSGDEHDSPSQARKHEAQPVVSSNLPAASSSSRHTKRTVGPAPSTGKSSFSSNVTKNSDDVEFMVGKPPKKEPPVEVIQKVRAEDVSAKETPPTVPPAARHHHKSKPVATSSPRRVSRHVRAELADDDEIGHAPVPAKPKLVQPAPQKEVLSAAEPTPRSVPIRTPQKTTPSVAASPRISVPPPAAPTPSLVGASKELLRLIGIRDQLRHAVADLKVAMEDPQAMQVVKLERARRRFFDNLEDENRELVAAVEQLRSDATYNKLSDRILVLAKEISAKELELKSAEKERRRVAEEIKHFTKAAGGDDVTAAQEVFIKKQEQVVSEQETNKLRHRKQMDTLAAHLERLEKNISEAQRRSSQMQVAVDRDDVADMDPSEYNQLSKQSETNRKQITHLKQVLAALDYTYEAPASVSEWQDKRFEQEQAEIEAKIHAVLRQIKQKEDIIIENYGMTSDRPKHFLDPSDPSRQPRKSNASIDPPTIARVAVEQPQLQPQPPKRQPQPKPSGRSHATAANSKEAKPLPEKKSQKPVGVRASSAEKPIKNQNTVDNHPQDDAPRVPVSAPEVLQNSPSNLSPVPSHGNGKVSRSSSTSSNSKSSSSSSVSQHKYSGNKNPAVESETVAQPHNEEAAYEDDDFEEDAHHPTSGVDQGAAAPPPPPPVESPSPTPQKESAVDHPEPPAEEEVPPWMRDD